MSIPSLVGSAVSAPSGGEATVYMTALTNTAIRAQAPSLTFTFITASPSVYTCFWASRLEPLRAQLPAFSYSVTPACGTNTGTSATLTVNGASASAGYNDIAITFRQANIDIKLTG